MTGDTLKLSLCLYSALYAAMFSVRSLLQKLLVAFSGQSQSVGQR